MKHTTVVFVFMLWLVALAVSIALVYRLPQPQRPKVAAPDPWPTVSGADLERAIVFAQHACQLARAKPAVANILPYNDQDILVDCYRDGKKVAQVVITYSDLHKR